ncbi:hypothetical protein GCK72_013038 [Caenorhabditis remanei]|uniref:Uncharacterized protein n=1 Tax=Caenorhabditis remanei TaxID=31234 RepID=A0A6A5GPY8_CAERE|nr:hypothetical protein GCK72_013038 [Caenorhabditis remanei]KAF1756585.1 hypothetical protein GCK72_013038 [Caenorhabditis remanei]
MGLSKYQQMDEGIDWDCCFMLLPHSQNNVSSIHDKIRCEIDSIGLERSEKGKEHTPDDSFLEKNEGRKQLETKPRQFEKQIPDPRGSIHRENGNVYCGRACTVHTLYVSL